MDSKTQQTIIIILGVLGLASIITGYHQPIEWIIIGLIGFLSSKNLTEKQQELREVEHVQHTKE